MDCKDCRKKDEKMKNLTDGIRHKIQAYKELSVDSPLPVSHLIASVLNVLNQIHPVEAKREDEKEVKEVKEPRAKEEKVKCQKEEKCVSNSKIKSSSSHSNSHSHRSSSKSSSSRSRPHHSSSKSKSSHSHSTSKSASSHSHRTSKSSHSHHHHHSSKSSAVSSSSVKKHETSKTGTKRESAKRKSSEFTSCPIPVKIQTPDISSSSPISPASHSCSLQKDKDKNKSRKNPSERKLTTVSFSNPVEIALKMPKVLELIFKSLNYEELQSCSVVGPLIWKEEADRLFSLRTLLNITFGKGNKISVEKSLHNTQTRCDYREVSHLTTSLRTEEKGNEIWMAVSSTDLSSAPLSAFFQECAPAITRLTLFYGALNKMTPQEFHGLLLKLPNLTNLILATIPSEWKSLQPVENRQLFSSDIKDRDDVLLPRIKTVVFQISPEFYPEFIQSLLQIVPNVKQIYNFPLYCIKALELEPEDEDEAMPLPLNKIKSICFSTVEGPRAAGEKMVKELSLLAQLSSKMELQNMHLNFKMASQEKSLQMWVQCCESLSSILQSNQKSLKHLKIEPFPLPQYLEYPEMSGFEDLHLFSSMGWKKCENAGKVCKFFPEDFNIRETFPNLTKVKFEGTKCALGEFLHFFPEDVFQGNPSSGFKNVSSLSLKFKNFEDVESLQKAASLFPGVTNFSMDGDVRWLETRLLHILNLWPRLQKLKLTVDVVMTSGRLPSVQMYPLDSVFTGIPEVKCAELRAMEEKLDINIHEWQEDFAISNMTDLTELKLIFAGNFAKTQKVIPLFSHVTPLYGFQLLPNLKVVVGIQWDNIHNEKIQQMLEPIQNYVDFHPNYY